MQQNQDPATLLLNIRSNPNTLAATLKSDWLPMTLKAATGGVETFTLKFYNIRGKQIGQSADLTAPDTTEVPLAKILTDTTTATAWDVASLPDDVPVAQIAYIAVSNVVGTIYIGRGAESNTPYGDFTSGTTYSITGPAAGTTPVIANTSYGIGA